MTEHEKLVLLIRQAHAYIKHLEEKIEEIQETSVLKPGAWRDLWRVLKTAPLRRSE